MFYLFQLGRTSLIVIAILPVFFLNSASGNAEEVKLYGGYSLEEWRQIAKNTDFRTLADPHYVNGLKEVIRDSQAPWASRKQAGETLGRIGESAKSAVPLLQELLREPGSDAVNTRLWVLKSLSLFGTVAEAASQDVRNIILDPKQPHLVRLNSMETLGRIGRLGEIALPTFLSILQQHPNSTDRHHDELRVAAAEALWILGPFAAPALPALIDAAREDWSPMRLAAIVSIGEIGPRAEIAIPLLVDAILFDQAGEVREVAADALGKIGMGSLPALLQLQDDPEEEVRRFVIRAATQLKNSPQVKKLLLNGIEDSSSLVNIDAANEMLKRQPTHEQAIAIMVENLGSSHRRSRLTAYQNAFDLLFQSPALKHALQESVDDFSASSLERSAAKKLLRKMEFDQLTPATESIQEKTE